MNTQKNHLEEMVTLSKVTYVRRLDKSVYQKMIFFLFLNQIICCGCSKELSHRDGSFEYQKHMFKLMGKKIITILLLKNLLHWLYIFRVTDKKATKILLKNIF